MSRFPMVVLAAHLKMSIAISYTTLKATKYGSICFAISWNKKPFCRLNSFSETMCTIIIGDQFKRIGSEKMAVHLKFTGLFFLNSEKLSRISYHVMMPSLTQLQPEVWVCRLSMKRRFSLFKVY